MVEHEYVMKIMVIGELNTGKTTFIARYVDGRFITDTRSTIGVDFSLKQLKFESSAPNSGQIPVALQIWDVAGEHKFRDILPYYIQGTMGLILTFDCTKMDTLESLDEWLEIIGLQLDVKSLPLVLISTKNDLKCQPDQNRIDNFIKRHNILNYYATSAKLGTNVTDAFKEIAGTILKTNLNLESLSTN